MDSTLDARHRAGSPTVCRFAELSLDAVEAAVARLRHWAIVREVQPRGAPFIRLSAEGRVVVHLPIAGCADPQAETGIIPGRLQPGEVVVLARVPFRRALSTAEPVRAWLESEAELSGPIEFHSRDEGFAFGDLVFPVAHVLPRLHQRALATA